MTPDDHAPNLATPDPIEGPRLIPAANILPSGRMRARSISVKRLSKHALAAGRAAYPAEEHAEHQRPRTRAECPEGPCPWVSCKHHLYLDVSPVTGAIKINFPNKEPGDLVDTCALAVAERGNGNGVTLEEVGDLLNITRERVRQLESRALVKLRRNASDALRDHAPVSAPAAPAVTHDPEREDRNLRALALAGWTRIRVDIAGSEERWRDPEGRIVSRSTAIRTARALLTVVL